MKINKEMFEHLLRWHLEYQTTSAKDKDMRDAFTMIKYLFEEIEKIKESDK